MFVCFSIELIYQNVGYKGFGKFQQARIYVDFILHTENLRTLKIRAFLKQ